MVGAVLRNKRHVPERAFHGARHGRRRCFRGARRLLMRLAPTAYRLAALVSGQRGRFRCLIRTGPPCSIAQVRDAARAATTSPARLRRGTF